VLLGRTQEQLDDVTEAIRDSGAHATSVGQRMTPRSWPIMQIRGSKPASRYQPNLDGTHCLNQ
jgi:hypothetical protein